MRYFHSFLAIIAVSITPAFAQLAPPNEAGVTLGHFHLIVKDVDAQKDFWVSILGGKVVKNGPLELIQFPGVYIMLRQGEPTASPEGSILNHFGFVVRDMPAALAKWKARKLKIEPTENPNESYVYGPDGVRVEVYGIPALANEVQMNHVHFYASDIPGMKAWYVKTFGASPGQRACVACISHPMMIETGNLPGMVNLSFGVANAPQAPTKGRAIDHIGFEVKNLDEFAKKIEMQGIKLDVPVHQIPNGKTKIAFLTDPWGTYIELTEGLAPIKD
jgi:catechol 2,3-dioxygenase-like lactoylglutathione lyase family enzyme